MKLLTLIRHAKSSWKDMDLADVDRPLNSRGKRDAPEMAKRLARGGFAPDLVLSSPAKRARRTAKAVIAALDDQPDLGIEHSIYMAGTAELFELVRALGKSLSHVVLVGHNPDMTEFANLLGSAEIDNIPTSGVVRLELDIDKWGDATPGCGRVLEFDYPKKHQPGD